MLLKGIPEDINVELLLSYFPEGSCKTVFKGLHKRNAYNDIIDVEEKKDGTLELGIGRHSLYNSLPEFMFHTFDRFGSLAKKEDRDRFTAEYQKQEAERESAFRFFAPIDLLLLKMRVSVREQMQEYVDDNRVLIDILSDGLTDIQRANRFVRRTLPLLPSCKHIRGDKTLLTFMLRKVFMDEGLRINLHGALKTYRDDSPRYADGLDSLLGEGFVGNVYDEMTTCYDVYYWSDDECNENFLQFVDDVEVFRGFVQDYFLSVEAILHFEIYKDAAALRLSDDIIYNYLSYNTNL